MAGRVTAVPDEFFFAGVAWQLITDGRRTVRAGAAQDRTRGASRRRYEALAGNTRDRRGGRPPEGASLALTPPGET